MVELPALDLQVRGRQRPLEDLRELLSTLFLHGLAGSGSEWDALQARVPAEAPDLRRYGSRDEYVEDVIGLIAGRRVTLIGQSLGGHTGILVAARRPDLVERLIVIEASPERDAQAPARVRAAFAANPRGYGFRVDPERAAATVAELAERGWWDEWARIECPTLVVRGQRGQLDAAVAARMGGAVVIPDAGHDVHLDAPGALADAILRSNPT